MPPLIFALFFIFASLRSKRALGIDGDCPLDFSWSNFTLAASACSDPNERGTCCRYINAFVAISVAHYANETGMLGVPSAFSEVCLDSISETFSLHGIPATATAICGLGPKIRVSYQCQGRDTVLKMMQAPNFNDVIETCQQPLSLDSSCKRCLNSGILFLHQLVKTDDNVTLSVCRNAMFVALANLVGSLPTDDMASCFFGVQGLTVLPAPSPQVRNPVFPTSPASPGTPRQQINTLPIQSSHSSFRLSLISVVGIGVIIVSVFLLLMLILLIRKKSEELKNAGFHNDASWSAFPCAHVARSLEGPTPIFQRFSYKEIKKATDDFSTVIGKGGFGTVYKAQFSDGTVAAIKHMSKVSRHGEEDFCREMELVARLHHRHLVALRGFCVERKERFLVYEYMTNGSLKDHLHSPGRKKLSWKARMQIAVDVANALEYLHFYCDPPLCHRDIKSSNILLDDNFTAKLSDFGLAHATRSGAISFEPVNTDIRGTPGYMDPEYVLTQELTEKSDVYSYGVLLLELLTGRRVIQDGRNLVEWSQQFMTMDSKLTELVDPSLGNSFDFEQLHVVTSILQWCTQREARARPSIKQVLMVLSERLDPVESAFMEGGGDCYAGDMSKERMYQSFSGDARCLQSSSSTTRSYCSRSVLLDHGSTQSPPGMPSL